jgi:hypothetical protein
MVATLNSSAESANLQAVSSGGPYMLGDRLQGPTVTQQSSAAPPLPHEAGVSGRPLREPSKQAKRKKAPRYVTGSPSSRAQTLSGPPLGEQECPAAAVLGKRAPAAGHAPIPPSSLEQCAPHRQPAAAAIIANAALYVQESDDSFALHFSTEDEDEFGHLDSPVRHRLHSRAPATVHAVSSSFAQRSLQQCDATQSGVRIEHTMASQPDTPCAPDMAHSSVMTAKAPAPAQVRPPKPHVSTSPLHTMECCLMLLIRCCLIT